MTTKTPEQIREWITALVGPLSARDERMLADGRSRLAAEARALDKALRPRMRHRGGTGPGRSRIVVWPRGISLRTLEMTYVSRDGEAAQSTRPREIVGALES